MGHQCNFFQFKSTLQKSELYNFQIAQLRFLPQKSEFYNFKLYNSDFHHNKAHMCVNLGFFPGISSCKRQKVDMIKSQLSFVDCFTA